MFGLDWLTFLPFLVVSPIVLVPAVMGLVYRFGSEGRARELGYRHYFEGKDISDQFVSYELGAAYRRGLSAGLRDKREVAEYRKQREDRRLLR